MIPINPRTKQELDTFCSSPTHALLLTGEQGSGTMFCATYALEQLGLPITTFIEPDEKGTISIDKIRELRSDLRHKQEGSTISRAVVITSIGAMQTEAQNALLKLLEEPPIGTLLILISSSDADSLDTIRSRAVQVAVLPISLDQAIDYYKATDIAVIKRIHTLSNGLAQLLDDLINNNAKDEIIFTEDAKKLLGMTVFDRLITIDKLYKKRADALAIVTALQRVCHAALSARPDKTNWLINTKLVLSAHDLLVANVQPKLVLAQLFVSLK